VYHVNFEAIIALSSDAQCLDFAWKIDNYLFLWKYRWHHWGGLMSAHEFDSCFWNWKGWWLFPYRSLTLASRVTRKMLFWIWHVFVSGPWKKGMATRGALWGYNI
jgi:hypothetical protein